MLDAGPKIAILTGMNVPHARPIQIIKTAHRIVMTVLKMN